MVAKNQNRITFIILLLPAFFIITAFILYPVINTVIYSVFKWNGYGPLKNFVGFGNLSRLINDGRFWNALKNNAIIIIFSLGIQLPIALLLAVIVTKKNNKSMILFRTIFFLPFILSEIITGVIWKFIYHPQTGVINYLYSVFAPEIKYTGYLASPDTVFLAILFVLFWKYFGLHMIIYIAGLQGIPQEYYEAARIDGANNFQLFRYITIPLLRMAIQISVFFCIIGSIQVFDVIWAMGQGDPVHAAETSVVYLFKFAIKHQKLGYGSMIAIVLFLICLAFSLLYQKVLVKND